MDSNVPAKPATTPISTVWLTSTWFEDNLMLDVSSVQFPVRKVQVSDRDGLAGPAAVVEPPYSSNDPIPASKASAGAYLGGGATVSLRIFHAVPLNSRVSFAVPVPESPPKRTNAASDASHPNSNPPSAHAAVSAETISVQAVPLRAHVLRHPAGRPGP